ncbi:uncharacterized protein PAC_14797 [Phialocephala subalpina]|uniref:Uncharacterized protein n=1 Tax=Phialocephala subalpina TaxID=576137 RepID=A0A1L7XIW7_9HELO|nr:uncharacterized protein PAC_14797 [Phialocephala subalpina]
MSVESSWNRPVPTPFPMDVSFPSMHISPSNGDSQVHPIGQQIGAPSESLAKFFAEETRTQASISMCLRLERLLGQEVSKRISLNNLINDLRYQLQQCNGSLEVAQSRSAEIDNHLTEAKMEIERLTSMIEGTSRHKATDTDDLYSQSEGSSDDSSIPAVPSKRKMEPKPPMAAPSPKRAYRRPLLAKSPAPISPKTTFVSPVTPIPMNNYGFSDWS